MASPGFDHTASPVLWSHTDLSIQANHDYPGAIFGVEIFPSCLVPLTEIEVPPYGGSIDQMPAAGEGFEPPSPFGRQFSRLLPCSVRLSRLLARPLGYPARVSIHAPRKGELIPQSLLLFRQITFIWLLGRKGEPSERSDSCHQGTSSGDQSQGRSSHFASIVRCHQVPAGS